MQESKGGSTKQSTVTVLFWNIWEKCQSGELGDGSELAIRLDSLCKDYRPDVIGLNEVMVDARTGKSEVIDCLKALGYFVHFAFFSPMSDVWHIGSLIATRQKPITVTEHILGKDYQAERMRGYKGCSVKAIEADVQIGEQRLSVISVYLSSLWPIDWPTHWRHRRALNRLLASKVSKNITVIAGGDFNEMKYMLPWLLPPSGYAHATGGLSNPTWRLNGKARWPLVANYDHAMWTKAHLQIDRFTVLPRSPSDHAPLLCRLNINP